MKLLLLVAGTVPLFAVPCQKIGGAAIRARDIAGQVPAFAVLDAETEITAAPLAGVRRVIPAVEILRLARRFGVGFGPSLAAHGAAPLALPMPVPEELCFEQAAGKLDGADVLGALRAVFPRTEIELIELTEAPVPKGKLEFARGGLEPSGLWHGRVVYGSGRSVSVWAKVRITEPRTWVEAVEVLPAGKTITEQQLMLRSGAKSPLEIAPVDSIEKAVGRKPTRTVGPGTALYAAFLVTPPQVARGDKVAVQVSQGGALLEFEAEAESPGHVGDVVFLRNPETGRRFQAKVEGEGKVAIRR